MQVLLNNMKVLFIKKNIQALFDNIQALLNSIHVLSLTKARTSQYDFLCRIMQVSNTFPDRLCAKKKDVEPRVSIGSFEVISSWNVLRAPSWLD